jgi:hypothetical protein
MNPEHRPFGPLVTFNEQNLTLTLHGPYDYEIDIEEWTDSAEMLDWILQIANKTWCSPELLYQFVMAIEEICHIRFDNGAQGVFCPFGQSKTVKWR